MTRILNPTQARAQDARRSNRQNAYWRRERQEFERRHAVVVMGLVRPTHTRIYSQHRNVRTMEIEPKPGAPRQVQVFERFDHYIKALDWIRREYDEALGGRPCPLWIEHAKHPARAT